jgi:hypothetical protein
MSRLCLALPLLALLLAMPVSAESSREHSAAAKKAEKAKNWQKALQEWEAAYKIEPNAEYLIGMGDAYAKLGDKANAKKQYQAYMSDPLALDTDSVKSKIAGLDSGGGAAIADLGLDLSGPPSKPSAAASTDLGLDLSPAPVAKKGKKEPKKKPAAVADDLGFDPPTPAPKPPASGDLALSPPPPAPAPKKPPEKVASDLDFDTGPKTPQPAVKPTPAPAVTPPPAVALSTPPAPARPTPAVTSPAQTPAATAAVTPKPAATTPVAVAATTPGTPPAPKPAPKSAPTHSVADPQGDKIARQAESSSGGSTRIVAYVSAGLSVGALAVGGLYFTKASQDSTDLRAKVRDGASQQSLIEQQKQHKSLSFAGIAAGLVLGGVAGALFAF